MSTAPASRDIVRAGCGAALFGIPLLYTMEVWWAGSWTSPTANIALVLAVLVAATVIDRTAGFRFHDDRTWRGSVIDGVEVVAICAVGGAALLVVIGEIDASTPWAESLAKVIAQLVPLVIGASIANEILGTGKSIDEQGSDNHVENDGDESSASADQIRGRSSAVSSVAALTGAAMLGAVVVALAIAPTDEVIIIAGRASLWHLLGLTVASLLVSHALVFATDFGRSRRTPSSGLLVELGHSGLAYGTAIVMSAVMLGLYGRLDGVSALTAWSRVVALGFPASIGAAAGRLAT